MSTQAAEKIDPRAQDHIKGLMAEKNGRTPAQRKMDSQLVYHVKRKKGGAVAAPVAGLQLDVTEDLQQRVLVDVKAKVTDGLRDFIKLSGGAIVSDVPRFGALRVLMPTNSVEALAGRGDVTFVEPAVLATTNAGPQLSEAVRTHRAGTALNTFGADGTGIKIGVLSDGVNSLAVSKSSGNLNAFASTIAGQAGSGDEGTAMMELIQDMLPGAQLVFATAFGGNASFANNILALQAAGCSVIVDDVTYFNESPFQDQVISQAVTTVSNAGVMYFSSARNSGNKNDGTSGTWEGDFVDGGAAASPITTAGNLLDFGGGTTFNTVGAGGSSRRVDFFWSDPLGASSNDYDLFVLNSTGTAVLRSSTNIQSGTQDPYESTSTLNAGERIVIVKKTGAANRFLHLDTGRAVLTISTGGNVRGHNAAGAANAFSVAATDVDNSPSPNFFVGGVTNPVETFSSDGPRRMFYQPNGTPFTPGNVSSTGGIVLNKPDITAADGAVTSVPGFTAFFGTSAAAPNAAAIAAMLKSYNSSLTPAQIRTLMTSTALDIEAVGLDRDSGSGIVMALQSLQAATAPDALTIGETGLDSFGPAGGPFTPTSGTYTLTNTSGSPVNWTAAKTQSWITLSPTSGTLAGGASVTLNCVLKSDTAAGLAAGNYTDTVTIANTSSGFSRNLSVTLAISTAASFGHTATALPNDNSTSVNGRAPMTRYTYIRSVYLITAAELAANGLPNGIPMKSVGWTYQTAPGTAGSAPLTIYMQNTSDTTNTKSATWSTAISGMTTVHSATTSLPGTNGAFDITFTGGSPFTYTGGGLYIAFDWGQYTGTLSTTAVALCNSLGLTNGILTGQTTTTTVPTTLGASNFRPETRLSFPYAPMVTTPTSSGITASGATLGGNVTQDWGAPLTARGVVYAKTSDNSNPQIGGAGVTVVNDAANTTGVFAENISGLTSGTSYSFVAFATNGVGTTYTSPVGAFTTSSVAAPSAPVLTTVGDVVSNAPALDSAGAADGTLFALLGRSGYLAPNGVFGFQSELKIGAGGVTVSPNNFQAYFKGSGSSVTRLVRAGDAAPGAGGATFVSLPLVPVPGMNSMGQITMLGTLRIGTGSIPVTSADDVGMWSETGGSGLQLLARENDPVTGVSGALISSFGFGCYATATTGASTGEVAFTIKMKGTSTTSALIRRSITGAGTGTNAVIARETVAAPGTAEVFGALDGTATSAVRMDPNGIIVFEAQTKPSNKYGLWYQVPLGSLTKLYAAGDVAPSTSGATFSVFDLPSIGSGGTVAFRALLNANTGDNAGNAKNDGIWRGSVGGAFTPILRRGDSGLPGMPAGSKVGNSWSGWLNLANHGAWLCWVDTAGDGISPYPADTYGIFTDLGGTMKLLISSGDAAPGISGANMFFIDHPVVGGNTVGSEYLAFLGTVTGGGVTAGTNDKGLWRSTAGGAPELVLRAGDTMTTSAGSRIVQNIDIPGSGFDLRIWEQPVIDNTGRIFVYVTFTTGETSQVFVNPAP